MKECQICNKPATYNHDGLRFCDTHKPLPPGPSTYRKPWNGASEMPRRKKETIESDNLYEKFETDVPPPPNLRASGKYFEFTQAILSVPVNGTGAGSWMRFLFADKKAAGLARAHLSKLSKDWKADGFKCEGRVVPTTANEDEDGCWLYVRRVKV